MASATGKLFVPKTAETFSYDLDGNLTNDGRWSYIWDAENRVTSFTRNSAAPTGSRVKLDCQYDSKSRRMQKIVSTWNGSSYVPQSTNKFVYDGWNLIAVLDATNGLVQSFTWGLDASGTMQGAGGVGGLISMTVHQGTNAGTYFYCFDGNHNVTTLVNATNGAIAAQYEFDAFGNPLCATGPLAFINPFTFSTKFCDWETGLLYYGYRYYDPDTERWLSRDPIGDWAFLRSEMQRKPTAVREHLKETARQPSYLFVRNNPESRVDWLGLSDEADITWGPAPCPNGQGTIYIQVLYGGIGPYSGPRVDDGSAGFFGGGSKGCPNYKTAKNSPDIFQDSSGGLTGPVEFIVCRVCTKPCCAGIKFIMGRNGVNGSYAISGYSIVSVGPCVHWKKGDKGDLSDANTFLTFPGAAQAWTDGMNSDYPGVAGGKCTPNCGL